MLNSLSTMDILIILVVVCGMFVLVGISELSTFLKAYLLETKASDHAYELARRFSFSTKFFLALWILISCVLMYINTNGSPF